METGFPGDFQPLFHTFSKICLIIIGKKQNGISQQAVRGKTNRQKGQANVS